MAGRGHSIGAVVFSLTLALMMWGYVSLTRTYEDYIDLPLTVVAPPEQALLSTVPPRVVVRARGSGWQLLNLRLFNASSACTVDLGKLRPSEGAMYRITKADIIRSIVTPQTIQTLDVVDPVTMMLAVGDRTVRTVPIEIRHRIEARRGFVVVGTPTVEPTQVDVRGSAAILASVPSWPTQRLVVTDAHHAIDHVVAVSDSLSTLLNVYPATVRIRAVVEQRADRIVHDVPVELAQQSLIHKARTEPAIVRVIVRGGVEHIAGLNAGALRVIADAPDAARVGWIRPRVEAPPNVEVVGTVPPLVRYVERDTSAVARGARNRQASP